MRKNLFTRKRLLTRCCFFAFLYLLTIAASGQTKTVSGNVIDSASGEPLSGASVHLIGKNKGVNTGSRGAFSITVNAGDSLVITHVGYRELHIIAAFDGVLHILLAP